MREELEFLLPFLQPSQVLPWDPLRLLDSTGLELASEHLVPNLRPAEVIPHGLICFPLFRLHVACNKSLLDMQRSCC